MFQNKINLLFIAIILVLIGCLGYGGFLFNKIQKQNKEYVLLVNQKEEEKKQLEQEKEKLQNQFQELKDENTIEMSNSNDDNDDLDLNDDKILNIEEESFDNLGIEELDLENIQQE